MNEGNGSTVKRPKGLCYLTVMRIKGSCETEIGCGLFVKNRVD